MAPSGHCRSRPAARRLTRQPGGLPAPVLLVAHQPAVPDPERPALVDLKLGAAGDAAHLEAKHCDQLAVVPDQLDELGLGQVAPDLPKRHSKSPVALKCSK